MYNQVVLKKIASGEKVDFLFFWKNTPIQEVGPPCLSQWWTEHPFYGGDDNVLYKTAEHYMMAEKARLFGDEDIRQKIIATDHPSDVKKFGRAIKNFNAEIWDRQKLTIVVSGNIQKFMQNPALGRYLLSTGDKILVEASPYDRIWGIGRAPDAPNIEDPNTWDGENLLGVALMAVRSALELVATNTDIYK
jgi:ribA/ribD-fused uncharacterized protein